MAENMGSKFSSDDIFGESALLSDVKIKIQEKSHAENQRFHHCL